MGRSPWGRGWPTRNGARGWCGCHEIDVVNVLFDDVGDKTLALEVVQDRGLLREVTT